jgi:glycosyltransferase involved in cell wall biosynthesis
MKISVLTVCLNSEKTIRDTIESVTDQNYKCYEHIILDGNSSDNTLDIIKEYSDNDNIKIYSEKDEGIYFAMNKALALSSGDFVGFLNSDDIFASNDVLKEISNHTDYYDCIYGNVDFTEENDLKKVVRKWISKDFIPGSMMKGWMPHHESFYCKRKILEEFSGFNTQYFGASDYDLMLRILESKRFKSKWVDKVFVKQRLGGQSNISIKNMLANNFEALSIRNSQRKFKLPLDFGFFAKPLSKIKQYFNA